MDTLSEHSQRTWEGVRLLARS
ncbi:unnamed protein product [Linum tenue]|uniref:Uncharacterized protein n=1 Tax=Linum tenue TaxID=586396 RepID=A0AAV0RG83_9ROSI|nr:unnamed protein product [Linum tenue]CAI0555434.1 unnamed protein product [Linum tenue]